MTATRLVMLLVVALLGLAPLACSSEDDAGSGSSSSGASESSMSGDGGEGDEETVAVIEKWSETLRGGDAEGAAELFAIPSTVDSGVGAEQIADEQDALQFNLSLPCGAELLSTKQDGEMTIATFKLTERPGPGSCGDGTGARAKTAFVVEDGLITVWQRVPTSGGGGARVAPQNPV